MYRDEGYNTLWLHGRQAQPYKGRREPPFVFLSFYAFRHREYKNKLCKFKEIYLYVCFRRNNVLSLRY